MKPAKHLAHKIAFAWMILLTATTTCLYTKEYAEKRLYKLQSSNLIRQTDYNTSMIEQQSSEIFILRSVIMKLYMKKTVKKLKNPLTNRQ